MFCYPLHLVVPFCYAHCFLSYEVKWKSLLFCTDTAGFYAHSVTYESSYSLEK